MAVDLRTEISNPDLGDDGTLAVSAEARRRLGLQPGMGLSELVVDSCLVHVPDGVLVDSALARVDAWLRERGIAVDGILADIEAHKDEIFARFDPELAAK